MDEEQPEKGPITIEDFGTIVMDVLERARMVLNEGDMGELLAALGHEISAAMEQWFYGVCRPINAKHDA